jgi:hypothetical protein
MKTMDSWRFWLVSHMIRTQRDGCIPLVRPTIQERYERPQRLCSVCLYSTHTVAIQEQLSSFAVTQCAESSANTVTMDAPISADQIELM